PLLSPGTPLTLSGAMRCSSSSILSCFMLFTSLRLGSVQRRPGAICRQHLDAWRCGRVLPSTRQRIGQLSSSKNPIDPVNVDGQIPDLSGNLPEIRFQKSVGWLTEMNTRQLRVPFGTAPGLEDL